MQELCNRGPPGRSPGHQSRYEAALRRLQGEDSVLVRPPPHTHGHTHRHTRTIFQHSAPHHLGLVAQCAPLSINIALIASAWVRNQGLALGRADMPLVRQVRPGPPRLDRRHTQAGDGQVRRHALLLPSARGGGGSRLQ